MSKLSYYLKNKKVKLLLPRIIEFEWEKHKSDKRKETLNTLKVSLNIAKALLQDEVINLENEHLASKLVDRHYSILNSFFDLYARSVENTSDESELIRRAIEKIPPFHRNLNQMADTIFLLTVKEFCLKNKEDSILFVSNDGKAFDSFRKENFALKNEFSAFSNFKPLVFDEKNEAEILIKLLRNLEEQFGPVSSTF